MRKTLIAAALAAAPALALAQGMGYGPGMGMGYGPGMGMGYGPGMGGGLASLNLSDAQAEKVFAIQEDMHAKNFATMTKMRREAFTLQRLVNADKVDTAKVAGQQKKVDELRREMFKSHLEVRSQIDAVLTPEQRKQWRAYGRSWMFDGE